MHVVSRTPRITTSAKFLYTYNVLHIPTLAYEQCAYMCFRDITCSALQADANAFHPMTKSHPSITVTTYRANFLVK